jgi:tryptophan 7-halogenase
MCAQPLKRINSIVIAGGGTAGWMTAAALSKIFEKSNYAIFLVESPDIGTVGVGEATIPPLTSFNNMLGMNEADFMKKTQATFKLGIEFINWRMIGEKYLHGFGAFGANNQGLAFYNYWFKWLLENPGEDIGECSVVVASARKEKFLRAEDSSNSLIKNMRYAYHLDAGLYANYLKEISIKRGVTHIQGDIAAVNLDPQNGFIESLRLANGNVIAGDFFIDCTGFRSLLLGQALKVPYISWEQWLFCNSALAVPTSTIEAPIPYTKATAHSAGWQWRIPLQHRTGNGLVYSSLYMSDQNARDLLLSHLDGELLAEPKQLRFTPGRRERMWEKNCVALGLASGFIEPLESTSIHLIQTAIIRLSQLFPTGDYSPSLVKKYNDEARFEIEEVRDFIILHYKATARSDSAFWNTCREMAVPESLMERLELFISSGRVRYDQKETFTDSSWVSVLLGQGLVPKDYNPIVDIITQADLGKYIKRVKMDISTATDSMPKHEEYIFKYLRN